METIEKIKNIPYLTKTALGNAFDKNPNTLRNWIQYQKKRGSILRTKRGAYVFKSFLDSSDNAFYYSRFLSTKMIEPSYLSMESVLQDYQILTDSVFGYSIVTRKKTSSLSNDFGVFHYQSIKKSLFTGFTMQSYGDMHWYVASKAKALFDYLYFNQHKFSQFSIEERDGMRLHLEIMEESDWKECEKYLRYAPKKMEKIFTLFQSPC